ncbi:voltage-gated potassium channel Kch [Kitasatospora sp. MAP12-15]|uniref:NAD-binding protein n=1 Tax=unclassified Kitasatospora TaxID=2633591 RepID=UPI002474189B|nr:NAD(P)-binding protein [Kitasatospora sp. MAP12-44]MDH6113960.1 voltage-gated potassium channel Kch [Kitasatospora sp. MAP12-44]
MTQAVTGAPPVSYSDHYIVCGGNALAHRLILELVEHYEVPVLAIVPDRTRDHAPRIERLDGVTAVLEYSGVTDEALRAACVGTARGIALVDGDDQANIHAALSAQGRNPELRIVLRMYNQRLGEQIQKLLRNCAALSGSATAAPAFANGALDRPNSVQVGDRFIYVAYDADITAGHLCVAADGIDRQDLTRLRLLPDTGPASSEFIRLAAAFGEGGPIAVGSGARPGERAPGDDGSVAVLQTLPTEPPLRVSWPSRLRYRLQDTLLYFTSARLRIVLFSAFAAIAASFGVIWAFNRDFGWTVYITLLDAAGAAQPDQYGDPSGGTGGGWQRVAQVVITFCSITFVPVATAIMVEALASGRRGLPKSPSAGLREHVVVVGLGNVGTRVATLMREFGVPVACVERDPQARGIAAVRALGIPVLVGDGPLEDQLRRARAQHSRAVVAVTNDDAVNLEAALEARALRESVRIVVRLFDDDFAHHVYATLGNVASRSVSYLAAPAFAAALMGREVLGTLSVFRHVLLVAELTAEDGGALVGMSRNDIEALGGLRVLAVRLARQPDNYQWGYADRSRGLRPGDRVVLAATRSGLGRLNTAAPETSGEFARLDPPAGRIPAQPDEAAAPAGA